MVEQSYRLSGMTCGSCAMKIERAMAALSKVTTAHVSFGKRMLTLTSDAPLERESIEQELASLGDYGIDDVPVRANGDKRSVWMWAMTGAVAIAILFYLLQVLGMQSWRAPLFFVQDQWYLVLPLILGFATQVGLLRAIHLLAHHAGGAAVATSGGVSSGTMLACCMHNLVPLFPILGASGLATFFAAYQTEVFLLSIAVTIIGIGYMLYKYKLIKDACKTHHNE